jgi:hypothetical protein
MLSSYLNFCSRVALSMFCQIELLIFNRLFVPRVVSIMYDPLRSLGLPSIKFDLLFDWLNTNDQSVKFA